MIPARIKKVAALYDPVSFIFINALSDMPSVVDSRARRRWSSFDMRTFSLPLYFASCLVESSVKRFGLF